MTTLKQGDEIKDWCGSTRKILGVCGEVLHISSNITHSKYGFTATETQLKESNYTWDTPAWEPEINVKYWFVKDNSTADWAFWYNDEEDRARRDFLGIFETKEPCEAALLEIRRKLGK